MQPESSICATITRPVPGWVGAVFHQLQRFIGGRDQVNVRFKSSRMGRTVPPRERWRASRHYGGTVLAFQS